MEKFEYIRTRYNVPAEMFREVIVNERKGVITEDKGNYIGVVFYDDKKLMPLPCHPTWKVEYLDTFNYKPPKPKNAASKQRYRDYLHADSSLTFAEWLGIK
ncbi:hypothetical protein EV143_11828 [Flavobacterium chryseum]|uniref:hypothetical protein n=1 Tax=Flavobacterium sp. P3160 TaxID=2512113 RepID=UPI00105F0D1F|nr:hypothetical protein [Flavobacterium sp. P3160]TDO68844.1 hypothetical protein EV143_11828 [Flavobacterium sp. P3160]